MIHCIRIGLLKLSKKKKITPQNQQLIFPIKFSRFTIFYLIYFLFNAVCMCSRLLNEKI